jgi:hypothetical protein
MEEMSLLQKEKTSLDGEQKIETVGVIYNQNKREKSKFRGKTERKAKRDRRRKYLFSSLIDMLAEPSSSSDESPLDSALEELACCGTVGDTMQFVTAVHTWAVCRARSCRRLRVVASSLPMPELLRASSDSKE